MIKYVFFDLGLTLVENHMPERYMHALQDNGIDITLEEVSKMYHLANKYFMRERRGELGKGNRQCFEDYVALMCSYAEEKVNPEQVAASLEKQAGSRWENFSFTVSVLKKLKSQGFRLGLISNWDSTCRKVLKDNGLDELLDLILVSSEMGIEKPDRRIFERALEMARISPDECIYVGDNYYDDALGAESVGIRCYIINPPDFIGIEELRGEKIRVINDIREIADRIKNDFIK